MKRVGFEWQWTQAHSCGHTIYQAVYGGSRPDKARRALRDKPCPKCNLIALLGEHYGARSERHRRSLRPNGGQRG